MSGTVLTANLVNPYMVGRPLTGASASLYVGREDVFAWLTENLTAAGPPRGTLWLSCWWRPPPCSCSFFSGRRRATF